MSEADFLERGDHDRKDSLAGNCLGYDDNVRRASISRSGSGRLRRCVVTVRIRWYSLALSRAHNLMKMFRDESTSSSFFELKATKLDV